MSDLTPVAADATQAQAQAPQPWKVAVVDADAVLGPFWQAPPGKVRTKALVWQAQRASAAWQASFGKRRSGKRR